MPPDAPSPEPPPFHPPADLRWLAQRTEPALEPEMPIVDAHHHLFDRPQWRYTEDDLLADLRGGHRVVATVYLQCGEHYRDSGPQSLRPVGETEFVERVAARSASTAAAAGSAPTGAAGAPAPADAGAAGHPPPRLCAAIVGYADLTLGAAVREVLEAHLNASPGRFRGIRHGASADPDPAFARSGPRPPAGLMRQRAFREGFAVLADYGLSFDAWLYHPQIPELIDLARAFPATTIVLDHVGAPLGIGGYAGRRDEVFGTWRASIRELASCPNVVVKLGGLGMRLFGFGFHEAPLPPASEDLARAWRPYVETCVDAFGPARCMFESNFPVDQLSCSYVVLWNAFKRLSAGMSPDERAALFRATASRVYRL